MSFWSKGERPHINKMTDLEGEIREFVRQQHDFHRDDKPPSDNPASLIQRTTGAQKRDIENVIVELQAMREKLQSEGARVQRRVLDYVTLSQSATQSAKIISETLRNNRPARLLRIWTHKRAPNTGQADQDNEPPAPKPEDTNSSA